MGFDLRVPNKPFTGRSYRPRSHIVEEEKDVAICGFEPKQGWFKIIGKKIEDVGCQNCQRTYIRYLENLFGFESEKGWKERIQTTNQKEAE